MTEATPLRVECRRQCSVDNRDPQRPTRIDETVCRLAGRRRAVGVRILLRLDDET